MIGVFVCLIGIVLMIWVSLIFGIALFVLGILLLLAQQMYASRNPEKWNPKAFKQCPYCAEPVKKEAVRCKHCGADLSTQQPPQPIVQNVAAPLPAGSHGTVRQDVVIDGVVAFRQGEILPINAVSPDPGRQDYRYVVQSAALNKSFRLSDRELYIG